MLGISVLSFAAPDVEFSAAAVGHAGLPNWLSILQVSRASPAYLHGTPAANDIGNTTVEVSNNMGEWICRLMVF